MFAAWRLPQFLLQALKVPARACAAVLDGNPRKDSGSKDDALLCVSRLAEKAGVHTGMRASQGLARCPKLECLSRSEFAEKQLQDVLLQSAETWTADFESTQPGVCLLDLRRAYRFQTPTWFEHGMLMHQDMRERGYELCIGLAETADLALLASHVAFPVKVIRGSVAEEKAAFLELPLSVLAPHPGLQETLHLWGIHTLGELTALKRLAVGERLGASGLELWDLARGGKDRILKLVRPRIQYKKSIELDNGIETLEPLLGLLRELAVPLCSELSLAWKVTAFVHLELRFDDGSSHQTTLRIAEPTRDVAVLLRVLETHLEGVKSSAPIIFAELEVIATEPVAAQDLLFERGLRDPNKFSETLSALEALLGRGRVGRGELLPTHRPDAFKLVSFLEQGRAVDAPSVNPKSGLPLMRFRPPWSAEVGLHRSRPASVKSQRHSFQVIDCRGPWLLSGHWWDELHAWEAEIWDIASQDGCLYRLVRENRAWRLEGRYA